MADPSQAIDATLAAIGHKTAQTGAITTLGGWVLSSEFGVLVGVVLGIAGLSIQWYYRRKQDQREQAEHERRMGLME